MIIALGILAFFVCLGVYMWTDPTEHMMRQQLLDEAWDDNEVGGDGSSPGDPVATVQHRTGQTATVAADIYPWPRVTVYQHTGHEDEAA